MKKVFVAVVFITTSLLYSMNPSQTLDSSQTLKLSPRKSKGPDSFQLAIKSRPRIDSDPVQRVRGQSDSKTIVQKIVEEHNKTGFDCKVEDKK